MDRLPSGAPAVTRGPGAVPFTPTALDRLVERVQRASPALVQASDVLLVAVAALLLGVDLLIWSDDRVVDTGRLGASPGVLVPCLGALAVVAIALRRRHPVGSLVVVAGAGSALTTVAVAAGAGIPPSFAALFALGLLTVGVLRWQPGRTATAVAVVAGLAVVAEAVRPQVAPAGYLLVAFGAAFAAAVGVGVHLRWADWRREVAAAAARADERLEIARELHDLVGHHLTAIVVQAQAVGHVAARRPDTAKAALADIERAGADALVAMRRMVGALRDDAPTAAGADRAELDRVVADAVGRGEPVTLTITPEASRIATAYLPSVHRIVVESLTNVSRHAGEVTRVDVVVEVVERRLVVSVRDDGRGGAPAADGFGLVGMRERVASFGGALVAGPAPGGGWLVRAELPLGDAR